MCRIQLLLEFRIPSGTLECVLCYEYIICHFSRGQDVCNPIFTGFIWSVVQLVFCPRWVPDLCVQNPPYSFPMGNWCCKTRDASKEPLGSEPLFAAGKHLKRSHPRQLCDLSQIWRTWLLPAGYGKPAGWKKPKHHVKQERVYPNVACRDLAIVNLGSKKLGHTLAVPRAVSDKQLLGSGKHFFLDSRCHLIWIQGLQWSLS